MSERRSGSRIKSALAAHGPVVGGLLLIAAVNAIGDLLGVTRFYRIEVKSGALYGSIVDVLSHAARTLPTALVMTLVIATRGVDLSVGAVAAVAGAVAAKLLVAGETGFLVAAAAALSVAGILGLSNGLLVARGKIQPIVATLVLLTAGRGMAQLITDGQIITFRDPVFGALSNGRFLFLPMPIWIAAGFFALLFLFARRTGFGLLLEAIGSNPAAARLSGVSAEGIVVGVYLLSGVAAGLTGLLAASNILGADANNAGRYLELDAIAAVVVGGTALTGGRFRLFGTVLGALLMQALTTTLYGFDVSAEIAPFPKAMVILVVAVLQSERVRARFRGKSGGVIA